MSLRVPVEGWGPFHVERLSRRRHPTISPRLLPRDGWMDGWERRIIEREKGSKEAPAFPRQARGKGEKEKRKVDQNLAKLR